MKTKKYIYVTLLLLLGTFSISSEEHRHEEHEHAQAILEVHREKGFRLYKDALETLKVSFIQGAFKIPKEALVKTGELSGVYRFRDQFFKFIPVDILKEEKESFTIASSDITKDDLIAVSNVDLLRVSDIFSKTDRNEFSHAH